MYENQPGGKQDLSPQAKQPEHLANATDFAKAMLNSFQPHELNEVVRHIRQIFAESRQLEIEETTKKLNYLENTLKEL